MTLYERVNNWTVITKLEHGDRVMTLAWSKDDQILAAGGRDKQVMCTAVCVGGDGESEGAWAQRALVMWYKRCSTQGS